MSLSEILTALLGGGGLASLAVFYTLSQKGKRAFDKSRSEHLEDLDKQRDELRDTIRELETMLRYYRKQSAVYEYQLIAAGIDPRSVEEDEG